MSNERLGIFEELQDRGNKFGRFLWRAPVIPPVTVAAPKATTEPHAETLNNYIRQEVNARLKAEVDAIISERVAAERADIQARLALSERPRLEIGLILASASAVTGIAEQDMIGPRRGMEMVRPRHLAMWLIKRLRPDLSLPSIGRVFNRDHTTVMHAVKKFEARRSTGLEASWLEDGRIVALFQTQKAEA